MTALPLATGTCRHPTTSPAPQPTRMIGARWRVSRMVGAASLALITSGCIVLGPDYDEKTATAVPNQPDTWIQPLPHGGATSVMADWWSRFDDPLLVELITAAQSQSNTMAQATLRIAQTRALLVTANAAALPVLNASGGVTRGTLVIGGPIVLNTTSQAQLQAGWEIDLFGGLARSSEAARARLQAQVAGWHDARISVAADTANLYTNYRGCEQLLRIAASDAESRTQTATLTGQLVQAGFQAPANFALARASAAEGEGRLVAQRAECDLIVNALVALTGMAAGDMRERLAARAATLPAPKQLAVQQVPAQMLAQRPDIAAAERDLAAASADIGVREADRFPRLTISGNIGPLNFSSSDANLNATSWTIGPTLSMPLFDGGRRAANVETAKIAYQTAEIGYRTQVRRAVREVEDALVRLDSMKTRVTDAQIAADGYREALIAAQARYKSGFASLLDLEETRRLSFNADNILAATRREHVNAWIALYRAVGGGWTPADTTLPAAFSSLVSSVPNTGITTP